MSIRSRRRAAEEENPLLPLLLGAVASLDALELALARDDDPRAARERPLDAAALAPDDPFVLAALGLLGLGRTLHGWLATAAATPQRTPHDVRTSRAPGSLNR